MPLVVEHRAFLDLLVHHPQVAVALFYQCHVVRKRIKARSVAHAENLDGRPLTDYVALVRICDCNLRMVYQKIEEGVMLDQ